MTYTVAFIFTRIFIQARISVNEKTSIFPLNNTGSQGVIDDFKTKLDELGYPLSREDYIRFLDNFKFTGQSAIIEFQDIEAESFQNAIDIKESEARDLMNVLSVISINPPQIGLAYALNSQSQRGVKFYIPDDPTIKHASNIPGYLDALPDLINQIKINNKLKLLLSLFRSALEQQTWVNTALFILILFEEASDNEEGSLAERLRSHSIKYKYDGDLNLIANELGVSIPRGKDVIDMIVKLRNAAAHNGSITEESLNEYNGEWIIPILNEKERFNRLLVESARYMIITLVGHSREIKGIQVSGDFNIRFE